MGNMSLFEIAHLLRFQFCSLNAFQYGYDSSMGHGLNEYYILK